MTENPPPPVLEAPSRFDDLIRKYALRYGVEPALVKAVMHAESGFRTRVRSLAGARGLMQVMPRTGRAYGVRNLYDPNENVRAGVRHLRFLLDQHHNDPMLALAAYNAGSGTVERYGGVPPFPETRRYVQMVLRYRRSYRWQMAATPSPASQSGPRS
jgi:soluble lytic murein transglycosylase-like protein